MSKQSKCLVESMLFFTEQMPSVLKMIASFEASELKSSGGRFLWLKGKKDFSLKMKICDSHNTPKRIWQHEILTSKQWWRIKVLQMWHFDSCEIQRSVTKTAGVLYAIFDKSWRGFCFFMCLSVTMSRYSGTMLTLSTVSYRKKNCWVIGSE